MATGNSTEQTGNDQEKKGINSEMCSSSVMEELWDRVGGTLTNEELKWFACATEHAEHVAFQLEKTLTSLGCLVSNDGDIPKPGLRSGNFQDHREVSTLLFGISQSLSNIRGLMQVGMSAQFHLNHPEIYHHSEQV